MFGLLSRDAVLEAAHDVYTIFYQRAEEDAGLPASDWRDVPRLPDAVQLPIVSYYLGRAHQAWNFDPGLVLHVMGITSDDVVGQSLALYRLLMGCLGHGVSLADEHREKLDRASEVPGGSLDRCPFFAEGDEWDELAREAVEARCTASQRGGEGPLPRPGTWREEDICRSGATTIPSRTASTAS